LLMPVKQNQNNYEIEVVILIMKSVVISSNSEK